MRVGLQVFGTRSGLGYQTRALYRHLQPSKTMLIDLSRAKRMPLAEGWYGPEVTRTSGPPTDAEVDAFLDGLDVVIACETPLNYRLFAEARRRGVRTILQFNPEFLDHVTDPSLPHPTVLAAPTPWIIDDARKIGPPVWPLPVPVDTDGFPSRTIDRVKTVSHIAGQPTAGDRNGTLDYIATARACRDLDVDWILHCQVPNREIQAALKGTRIELVTEVPEPGDLYQRGDLIVLPRRYGGLCLAKGTRVTMADGSQAPIETLSVGDLVQDDTGTAKITDIGERTVDRHVVVDVRGIELASSIDHIHLIADSHDAPLREVRAADARSGDWMLVHRPAPHGITEIDLGPKPVRKGLRAMNWPETVTLDAGWARIIGLWLAEGHRNMYSRPGRNRPQPTICWSFGEEGFAQETVRLLAERGAHATYRLNTSNDATYGPAKVWIVRCRSLWVYELLERLGVSKYSAGKRAPDLDASLALALVGGWLDGDGNVDGRTTAGWSTSMPMVKDMWRLCAKTGIFASISHNGMRLDIHGYGQRLEVAKWAKRMDPPPVSRVMPTRTWRPHPSGWMVKIRAVTHVDEQLDVVAIETTSGKYIAEGVLTHNCIPAQDAVAAGIPVLMPDCEPNDSWLPPGWLIPSWWVGVTGGGFPPVRVRVGQVDREDLSDRVRAIVNDPHLAATMAAQARAIGASITWDALLPTYLDFLDRTVELQP